MLLLSGGSIEWFSGMGRRRSRWGTAALGTDEWILPMHSTSASSPCAAWTWPSSPPALAGRRFTKDATARSTRPAGKEDRGHDQPPRRMLTGAEGDLPRRSRARKQWPPPYRHGATREGTDTGRETAPLAAAGRLASRTTSTGPTPGGAYACRELADKGLGYGIPMRWTATTSSPCAGGGARGGRAGAERGRPPRVSDSHERARRTRARTTPAHALLGMGRKDPVARFGRMLFDAGSSSRGGPGRSRVDQRRRSAVDERTAAPCPSPPRRASRASSLPPSTPRTRPVSGRADTASATELRYGTLSATRGGS